MTTPGLTFRGLGRLSGPYAVVDDVPGAAFHELVEIEQPDRGSRLGQVVAVYEQGITIEAFGPTQGMTLDEVRVRFLGHPARVGVGPEMLGRVLDSLGRPRDGMSAPVAVEERPLDGLPINPVRRECPRECIETGFSAIDGLNTLTIGQKLPIFTESACRTIASPRQSSNGRKRRVFRASRWCLPASACRARSRRTTSRCFAVQAHAHTR